MKKYSEIDYETVIDKHLNQDPDYPGNLVYISPVYDYIATFSEKPHFLNRFNFEIGDHLKLVTMTQEDLYNRKDLWPSGYYHRIFLFYPLYEEDKYVDYQTYTFNKYNIGQIEKFDLEISVGKDKLVPIKYVSM